MPVNHRILSCSKDAYLLRIRHWALQLALFEVVDAQDIHAVETLRDDDFDIVLLCHSLSRMEECRVREIVEIRWPNAAILKLDRHWIHCACSHCTSVRKAIDGSEA